MLLRFVLRGPSETPKYFEGFATLQVAGPYSLASFAARAIYDRLHREGAWDNLGALPDEINRDLWIEAAANGLRAAA